jgi:hypothetical protein
MVITFGFLRPKRERKKTKPKDEDREENQFLGIST